MASQALYRRYRSQTFDELIGQEHIVQTLRNALAEGRVAHAYLFTGPRGVGKTTVARLLAKAVNCTAEQALRPCGQCESCVAIAGGHAVDVIEMDAASHTSVEDAREIIERVQFRPTSSQYKVYVVDECFRYKELVTLADGSKHPIGKIVEEQWQADVLSYNEETQQIEAKPIVRHMRKQPSLPMVRITLNNNRAIVCTLNHKFYTPQGLLHAGELEPGQFVYANFERMTRHQFDVVAGAAIGDGYIGLTDSAMRARLSITQGVVQKEYLNYKAQLLGDLVQTAPYCQHSPQSFSKLGVYRLSTTSRPQIAQLHRELYDENGRKRITIEYLKHITPLGLALWYLDDGSLITVANQYTRRDGSVTNYPNTRSTLSVYGFTNDEAQIICNWFLESWDIEARYSKTAKGPSIWLTLAGTDRLHQIIAPFVPLEMDYKLLPIYRGQFCPPIDDMVINGLAVSKVKKVERVPSTEYVYNIEVADNHNYFVRDILVANCHMLSTAAFNALLKTLEEPPGHALFILATTEVHKVPATILSRCQRFTFSRHSVSSTSAHLRDIAATEGFALEAGAPEAIARAATGSMRDAISILDQLMAYGGETISLEQVRGLLGATESQEVTALIEALVGGDLTGALRVVAAVAEQGADLRQFSRDLVERLRALMLLKAGGDADLLDASADDMAVLERQSAAVDLGVLLAWVKLFSNLDYQLRTSSYGQLPLEMAIVEALAAPTTDHRPPTTDRRPASRSPASKPTADQQAVPAPPRADQQALYGGPSAAAPTTDDRPASVALPPAEDQPSSVAAPPAAVSSAEQDPPSVEQPSADDGQPTTNDLQPTIDSASPAHLPRANTRFAPTTGQEAAPETSEGIASANADVAALEQVEGAWPDVLQGVRARDKTLYALLNSGVRPIDVQERIIVLEVKSDWLQKRLEQTNLRQTVEAILSKQMGSDFGIRCVVEAQHRENPNALREQIRKSRKDQHVKAAINIFDAEIIAVEADQQGD